MTLRLILREPLLHFLVLGGLLFGLFGLTRGPENEGAHQIRVSAAQVEQLAAQFSRTWMRPPTEEELAGLIERHIRSEVFYREALAMGLDQDDPYVRNRLGQKLEFLLDDLSADTEPGDATLAQYLRKHAERFRAPARVSFEQVYLNPDRHPRLEDDAANILARLRAGAGSRKSRPTRGSGSATRSPWRPRSRWHGFPPLPGPIRLPTRDDAI